MAVRRSGERGTAAVEAALTLFTFFVFVCGIIEGARFLNVRQTISNAAREGSRFAVAPLTGTSTLPTTTEVQNEVQKYLDSAAITGATITVDNTVIILTGGIQTECTRVQVQVPYQLLSLPIFSNLQVTLVGDSLMRNETSP